MRHRNAVTPQFLCSRVQCGNATLSPLSMNGPLSRALGPRNDTDNCPRSSRNGAKTEQPRLNNNNINNTYTKGPFTNTCKAGGLMQKGGPLKFLTLVRGALTKITTDFSLKIEFTCFSMGLTCNFHGKKGGPDFLCGLKGGPEKFSR